MSYDNPISINHQFSVSDFGDGSDDVRYLQGPSGLKGNLRSISVETREVFATDSKTAKVHVGTATDADAYGALIIPDGTADNTVFNESDDTDAIISAAIPADSLVVVTQIFGEDASAVTGQGVVSVVIDWY